MRRKVKVISNRYYRHRRIRSKVSGTSDKPRLCVHRSLKHIEARLVDDLEGKTIISLSTRDNEVKKSIKTGGNIKAAEALGDSFAKKAKDKGVASVVFDRGGYLFQGRIRAFADSVRKNGLKF